MIQINDKDLIKYGFDCIDNFETEDYIQGNIIVTKTYDNDNYLVRIICSMPWIELPHIKYMEEIEQLYCLLHGKKLEVAK